MSSRTGEGFYFYTREILYLYQKQHRFVIRRNRTFRMLNKRVTFSIVIFLLLPEVGRGRVGNSIKTSLLINESRYNQIYNITSQLTKDLLLFIRYLRKWRMGKRSHRAELSHVPVAAARASASTTRCMMLGACAIILQACHNFMCVGGRWESGFQHLQLKLLF